MGSLVWEALALGAIGATLGVVLGMFLTQAVTAIDLYTRVVVSELYLDWQLFAQIWLLAVAMSALATVPALIELFGHRAAERSRSALEQRVAGTSLASQHFRLSQLAPYCCGCCWHGGWLGCCYYYRCWFVYGAHGFIRFGSGFVRYVVPCSSQAGLWRLAGLHGMAAAPAAAAALMLALATGVGVGIMVGSFRQTVVNWLELTLQADVYIGPADQP